MNRQPIEMKKEKEEFEKALERIGFYKQTRKSDKIEREEKKVAEVLFKLGYFS